MNAREPREAKERMIHVRLPEGMHKKVRIRAAETDQTIQDWVFEAIKQELDRQSSEK
jgi:predicted HicB family RNase H-like nuclease